MSMRKLFANKEEVYTVAAFALNFWLAVAVIFVIVYLVAPLVGGKLFPNVIMKYASWIGLALLARNVLKRVRKGLRIRAYDYSLVCLCVIINLLLWFSYPINIILSILSVVGLAFSYKAQSNRMRQENKDSDH
jgi:putative Mn2+ efflux pump MntP